MKLRYTILFFSAFLLPPSAFAQFTGPPQLDLGITAETNTIAVLYPDGNGGSEWRTGHMHRPATNFPTANLSEGDLFYHSTSNALFAYNGTSWSVGALSETDPVWIAQKALYGALAAANTWTGIQTFSNTIAQLGSTNFITGQAGAIWGDGNGVTGSVTVTSSTAAVNLMAGANSMYFSADTNSLGLTLFGGPLRVFGDVEPFTDSAYDLGANATRYAHVYADNLHGSVAASDLPLASGADMLALTNDAVLVTPADLRRVRVAIDDLGTVSNTWTIALDSLGGAAVAEIDDELTNVVFTTAYLTNYLQAITVYVSNPATNNITWAQTNSVGQVYTNAAGGAWTAPEIPTANCVELLFVVGPGNSIQVSEQRSGMPCP